MKAAFGLRSEGGLTLELRSKEFNREERTQLQERLIVLLPDGSAQFLERNLWWGLGAEIRPVRLSQPAGSSARSSLN